MAAPPPATRAGTRAARPRDAATLVLVRRAAGGAEILMGRRRPDHVFMPNVFVFPGGRVDRADARIRAATELRDEIRDRLVKSCSMRRARTLALSAIRETAEETGLLVGIRADLEQKDDVTQAWRAFSRAGLAPALDTLDYRGPGQSPRRGNPRRFHARFFVADGANAHGRLRGDGELAELDWIPVDGVKELPTAWITRFVANEVRQRLDGGPARERPIPVIKFRKIVAYD